MGAETKYYLRTPPTWWDNEDEIIFDKENCSVLGMISSLWSLTVKGEIKHVINNFVPLD
jgi:hypothetical protein